jgi:hypothetical protein
MEERFDAYHIQIDSSKDSNYTMEDKFDALLWQIKSGKDQITDA